MSDPTTPDPGPAPPDPGGEPTEAGPPPREERVYRGTGISVGAVVALILAVATIVFIAQNTASVRLQWLTFDFSWPLAAVVLAALASGAVLAGIAGIVWRHRRRRGLRQREELRRLRAERGEPERRGLLRR